MGWKYATHKHVVSPGLEAWLDHACMAYARLEQSLPGGSGAVTGSKVMWVRSTGYYMTTAELAVIPNVIPNANGSDGNKQTRT